MICNFADPVENNYSSAGQSPLTYANLRE
jgi:hypothetical protein